METKRVVIITGTSSGVGKELKRRFLENGDIVYGLTRDLSSETEFDFECDVTNEKRVIEIIDKIGQKHNKIDILVNCAGFGVFGAVELTPTENAKKMFDVNLFGSMNTCKASIKFMKKGSKIINISSACALFAVPFRSLYSASKSAVNMLSYGLRMELKSSGIEVTAICPGDIRTNFSKNRDITALTNERYGDRIEKSIQSIKDRDSKRMTVEYACGKIYKIINKKHLRPYYIISKMYNCLNFATRFTSTNAILKVTNKLF